MRLAPTNTFLKLGLLLQLADCPGHGYDLIARLVAVGLVGDDTGAVYHQLRRLEAAGLVSSTWDLPERAGPARRVYEITESGQAHLDESVGDAEVCHRVLEAFLDRYGDGGRDPKRKRSLSPRW